MILKHVPPESEGSVSSSGEWIRVATLDGPLNLRKSGIVEVAPYCDRRKEPKLRLEATLRVFDGENARDVFVTASEGDVMKHLGWGQNPGPPPGMTRRPDIGGVTYKQTRRNDRETGFQAGWDGRPLPDDASPEYKEGHAKGVKAEERRKEDVKNGLTRSKCDGS